MEKFFVDKSLTGYTVISEEFDEKAGNFYKACSEEFEKELEAQSFASHLNNQKFK